MGCRKIEQDPVARFMRRYNHDRPHMSLDWENQETPVQAYARKMPEEGEVEEGQTVVDGQTGEVYHAAQGGELLLGSHMLEMQA